MKRSLVIIALLAGAAAVNAQSMAAGMGHNQWEENSTTHRKTTNASFNEFASMDMSVDGRVITFAGIPETKKCAYAVITNGEGEFIKQMKITPQDYVMDIKKLRGGLYFVTIVYKNQSKKAFTLNL